MLRVNLEVTKTSTHLEQIEEVVILNRGEKPVDGLVEYAIFHLGVEEGRVWHRPGDGALTLARLALQKLESDPLAPLTSGFTNWQDFVERVARPMVEIEDDPKEEERLMELFRQASPYFICVSMVMMDNRLKAVRAKALEEFFEE